MAKKFVHEEFHDLFREMTQYKSDAPDDVYRTFIKEMNSRRETLTTDMVKDNFMSLIESGRETYDKLALSQIQKLTWWELFPFLLPPKKVNFAEAGIYMLYRLYSTGNTIYDVSSNLVDALYLTDFEIDFGQIDLPSKCFIVYWGNQKNNVLLYNEFPIEYTFCDFIDLGTHHTQMRMVFGYRDKDGESANSGIMTLTVGTKVKLSSQEFMEMVEATNYSELSQMEVPAIEKQNNGKVYMLMFNFLLYVMAMPEDRQVMYPHPDFKRLRNLKNPKKRRRVEKELKDESPYQYTYIGKEYDREVSADRDSDSYNEGKPLKHSVLVRGHWRHQWYGPREKVNGVVVKPGSAQKVVWIRPHWKGEGNRKKTLVYRVV